MVACWQERLTSDEDGSDEEEPSNERPSTSTEQVWLRATKTRNIPDWQPFPPSGTTASPASDIHIAEVCGPVFVIVWHYWIVLCFSYSFYFWHDCWANQSVLYTSKHCQAFKYGMDWYVLKKCPHFGCYICHGRCTNGMSGGRGCPLPTGLVVC